MSSPYEEHYGFMCSALDRAIDLVPSLKFDKTHKWCHTAISLYSTILELADSARTLIDHGKATGVPILLRSILEAWVDLRNLIDDPKYGWNIEAMCCDQWQKLLGNAKKDPGNPFLAALANLPKSITDQIDKDLQIAKGHGGRVLTNYDRFHIAGYERLYHSVYNDLCCESHCNLRALISRHTVISDDKQDLTLNLFRSLDFEQIASDVAITAFVVVDVTYKLHDKLQSKAVGKAQALLDELNARGQAIPQ